MKYNAEVEIPDCLFGCINDSPNSLYRLGYKSYGVRCFVILPSDSHMTSKTQVSDYLVAPSAFIFTCFALNIVVCLSDSCNKLNNKKGAAGKCCCNIHRNTLQS